MTIEEAREAARRGLVRDGLIKESVELEDALKRGHTSGRLAGVRTAMRRAIESEVTRETLTSLCRLYIAEQEAT